MTSAIKRFFRRVTRGYSPSTLTSRAELQASRMLFSP